MGKMERRRGQTKVVNGSRRMGERDREEGKVRNGKNCGRPIYNHLKN